MREKWVNKFIGRSWVRLAEPGQMQPACFSMVIFPQRLSQNSQIAWLLFSVGLSMKTSKSGAHMRSSALHSYRVMRTALTDQFLLPVSEMELVTNSARAKSLMSLAKNKNCRSLLIFVSFTWFQDPSLVLILLSELSKESVTSSVSLPPFSLHRISKLCMA